MADVVEKAMTLHRERLKNMEQSLTADIAELLLKQSQTEKDVVIAFDFLNDEIRQFQEKIQALEKNITKRREEFCQPKVVNPGPAELESRQEEGINGPPRVNNRVQLYSLSACGLEWVWQKLFDEQRAAIQTRRSRTNIHPFITLRKLQPVETDSNSSASGDGQPEKNSVQKEQVRAKKRKRSTASRPTVQQLSEVQKPTATKTTTPGEAQLADDWNYHCAVPNQSVDGQRAKFACICGKSYVRKVLLNEHIQAMLTGRIFECRLCPGAYAKHNVLQWHVRNTHKKKYWNDGKYVCSSCANPFDTNSELVRHRADMHGRIQGRPRRVK